MRAVLQDMTQPKLALNSQSSSSLSLPSIEITGFSHYSCKIAPCFKKRKKKEKKKVLLDLKDRGNLSNPGYDSHLLRRYFQC